MGADYIEIDLGMTRDGVLVAMHDDNVDRTTNGKGLVRSYNVYELKSLDAGSWFNKKYPEKARESFVGMEVPTLDEIFLEFGDTVNYYIETKQPEENPGMEKKLIALLEKHHLLEGDLSKGKVVIQSFSKQSLLEINRLYPDLPLIQLYWFESTPTFSDETLNEIKEYAVGIGLNHNVLTNQLVESFKERGVLLHLYTVDDRNEFKKLRAWGVNGIFTNVSDIEEM